MADTRRDAETAENQLRREAQDLLSELHVKLNQLDQVRAGKHARRDTPEERRRRFYVIRGGAAAVVGAALAWAWHVVRRPSVAAAGGTAGVGALVLPGLLVTQPPQAPPAPIYSPPPMVVHVSPEHEPADVVVELEQEAREVARVVEQPNTPDAPPPEPRPAPTYATSDPEPQQPPQTAKPEPEPTTPTKTPTPTPTVDVELTPAELCVEVGLPPTATLDACLGRADKLGVDVDLDLELLSR